jgi:hypothetical protein
MRHFTAIQNERTIFAQSTRCPLTLRTNNVLANDTNRKTNRCHFSSKQTRRPRLGKQTKHSPISCLFVLMITLDGGGDVLPAGARCAQNSSYVIIAEFSLQLGGELGDHFLPDSYSPMLLPVASINRVLACLCRWLPRCLPSRTLHSPPDALVPKPLPSV